MLQLIELAFLVVCMAIASLLRFVTWLVPLALDLLKAIGNLCWPLFCRLWTRRWEVWSTRRFGRAVAATPTGRQLFVIRGRLGLR